ncbi:MAG: hypothetical protein ACE5EE_00735 [Fidelibacterota bacterium]
MKAEKILDTTDKNSLPEQELEIIKRMIERTRLETADSGTILIMWGWLVLLACTITYIFVFVDYPELSWLPWVILMPIGGVVTIFYSIRLDREAKVVTYSDQAMTSLWQACGLAFFLVAFLAVPLKVISYEGLTPMIAIIAGIGMFSTGGIIEWKMARWSGFIWLIGAIVMMFSHWYYHTLILGITIIPGYLIPGYALKKEFQNK